MRWKGFAPNKVWDLAGDAGAGREGLGRHPRLRRHGGLHSDITKMHMLDGARSDKVSGVRDFYFGPGHLHEELLHLCDRSRSFSYRITNPHCPGSTTSLARGSGR